MLSFSILWNIFLLGVSIYPQYGNSQNTNYQATAYFRNYSSGWVTFINGHLMVEIDISDIDVDDDSLGLPSDCFDDGVYFHIHSMWEHTDMMDKVGSTDCGEEFTGGHWDPRHACSPASSAPHCQVNGGCISGSRYSIIHAFKKRFFFVG